MTFATVVIVVVTGIKNGGRCNACVTFATVVGLVVYCYRKWRTLQCLCDLCNSCTCKFGGYRFTKMDVAMLVRSLQQLKI